MAGNQLVLTGVPAFVAEVLGPTRVRFSIDENDHAANRRIEVDLARNTASVAPASWGTDVDVDYQTAGGRTTIGPTFHNGAHVGGVYLAERLVTQYAQVLASWPPPPDDRYQYQLVVRAGNGPVARYHGFKVRVVGRAVGTLVNVQFIRIGAAAPEPNAAALWIDVADPAVCDPPANGFTRIDPTTPVGTVGAIFLSERIIAFDTPQNPKIPKNLGW